jgi:hypothetical protein
MLPFLWIGATMSVRRAADAGASPWLGLGFLLPLVNYLLILYLACVRSAAGERWRERPHARIVERSIGIVLGSALASALLGIAMVVLCTQVLGTYALGLFVATPFAMATLQSYLLNRRYDVSRRDTFLIVGCTQVFVGTALLLFAIEGAICVLMYLPLALPLAFFGAVLGRAMALAAAETDVLPPPAMHAVAFAILASLAGIESKLAGTGRFEVATSIDIDAPRERVWQHVVSFSELPAPPQWYFRLGLAYPVRASIDGTGVGAVRHCEFSTGPFVEPITRWDEPSRLSFDVIAQPPPMTELSPYRHVHPPHLDGYFASRRGEFRLIALPDGRTRLEGSTWYELRLAPCGYWRCWADLIVHRIHTRVLEHVKALSEAP